MTFLRTLFGYPLFARELIERAARRRTYVARVVFGLALYAAFGLLVHRALAEANGVTTAAIGIGHQLLGQLVKILTWSLLLIQPAIMAGAIAREKERDALSVLFLTRLTPGKILLEKYLAGLFPAASLLLLALPLAAITMGYGGVSVPLLIASGMVLGAAWLMSGAWALFCSAWCRTSLGALLMAYLGGAFLFMLPPLVYSVVHRDVLFGTVLTAVDVPEALWAMWPHKVFESLLQCQESTFSAAAKSEVALSAATRCVPMFAVAGIFLLSARIALVARATARPARLTQRGLAWWTSWRRRHSEQPRHRSLPTDAPVAWREHSRSFVGSGGRFFYFSTLACGSVLALSIFLLGLYPPTDGPARLQKVGVFIACFGIFVIVATSISSLLSEKVNGTLDILFTTPVGIDQLLREKAEAVRRYWILFGVMLAIVFGAQAWSEYEYTRSGANWRTLGQQWSTGLLALAVYPPLLIWSSFLCAAWWGKRARAILAMLALVGIICLGPLYILEAWDPKWREQQSCLWWSLLSPLGILDANAHDRLPWFSQAASMAGRLIQVTGAPWVPVAVNFGIYTLLAFLVRWYCLRSADRMLRK